MKKVLIIANVYKHLYTFHIPYIEMLKNNGYQVDVLAAKDDREIPQADNSYYWTLTRKPFSLKNIKAYYQLKTILEREDYDLVHCHTATASVVARLAVHSLCKINKTKIAYTAHGFHFFKGSSNLYWWIFYPVEKCLSKWTDALILINKEDYFLAKKNFEFPREKERERERRGPFLRKRKKN